MARQSTTTSTRTRKASGNGHGNGHGTRTGYKPLCGNAPRPVPQLSAAVAGDPRRAAAIIGGSTKWANGTVLHYSFFGSGSRTR